MTFDEVLEQARELLQSKGRVAYRALKRRFELDDEYLEDLKAELIDAEQVARDEDGKVLVWVGEGAKEETEKRRVGESEKKDSSESGVGSPESAPPQAERRQLTVMFCDLVGSTALSAQLDPEELREVVRAYQETCTEVIQRYDGHVAQHLGDGLLVYFGYPMAHEDDAQRAVRAGLEIIQALQKWVPSPFQGEGQGEGGAESLSESPHPHPLPKGARGLQVRIGIHTGLVVVGEVGGSDKRETLALGETPNIAARLQGMAEPDTVVISAATYRLIKGFFTYRDLGPHTLKGTPTPMELYQVLEESSVQSRFEVVVSTGLTPLVGRDLEVGLLRERWAQAKGGEGQVILLSGEAGIGKSRLVQTLKEQVMAEGATRIEFRCSPYHQNSAFYPIIEHLQRLLQFQREESPQAKLEKLQQALARYRFPQADTVSLLAALLSLPQPAGTPALTLSPQKQKQKTQEALVAWLVEEAERQVVYCAWEDLHWADPSTLEFLTLFLDQVPATRLLTVLTFRPDFTPPWRSRSHITQLTLNRLGRQPVEAMVEKLTGGKPLPREVIQQIVRKTDGVPLFVEELTKMVLESGLLTAADDHYELSGPLPPLAIPSTLHASLLARLDRLSTVREIAQLGATLGREFSYKLLQAVSSLDEGILQQGLKQLVEAELLYQRGLLPQAHYLFKHALIQDTAYQSLLKSTRQQYHRQIAQVLEGRFPETVETQPELVAQHYTEAGLIAQAIPYWQQAGERASQRSAYLEAVAHLTKGLEVLKALLDTPERVQHELALQIALGFALTVTKGWAAPEVEKAGIRARELCQQLGETPQLFPVLFRLVEFYLNRGELLTLHEVAEQLMRLAQSIQDPYPLSVAHVALGATLSWRGELPSARLHVEQALALYNPQQHTRPTSNTAADPRMEGLTPARAPWLQYRWASNTADPRIECLAYAVWTLWPLGYPDQALKRSHELLAFAEGLSYPLSRAYALGVAAWCHQHRREGPLARERAEAGMTLTTEQGFPYFLAWGTIIRGWALAEQGQVEEGIAQMQQGLAAFRATGAEIARPYWLALLAEAYGKGGQVAEGLAVLTEALATVDKNEERQHEAELYRLKGELTLKQSSVQGLASSVQKSSESGVRSPESEAEDYFRKAIEIARRQSAKSLELRAVMSLSRLWQQQGKKDEARQLLAEIYDWFTEGFETKDLQEAKALLEELK